MKKKLLILLTKRKGIHSSLLNCKTFLRRFRIRKTPLPKKIGYLGLLFKMYRFFNLFNREANRQPQVNAIQNLNQPQEVIPLPQGVNNRNPPAPNLIPLPAQWVPRRPVLDQNPPIAQPGLLGRNVNINVIQQTIDNLNERIINKEKIINFTNKKKGHT